MQLLIIGRTEHDGFATVAVETGWGFAEMGGVRHRWTISAVDLPASGALADARPGDRVELLLRPAADEPSDRPAGA